MKKRYQRFQQDLRDGMSIEDALTKHGMTFKEAFENMERPHIRGQKTVIEKRKDHSPSMYINKIRSRYVIYKKVNDKQTYFGTYKTLTDAMKIRDCLVKDGWCPDKLDDYCRACGVERCTR